MKVRKGGGVLSSSAWSSLLIFRSYPSLPVFVLAVSVFCATAACFALLLSAKGDWKSWRPATCLSSPLGCFCEADRHDSLVRQPVNTFSNLCFTLVGVFVLAESVMQQIAGARRRKTRTESDKLGMAFATTFGLSQTLLGFGSAWYHASLSLCGQVSCFAFYELPSARMIHNT